MMLFRTCMCLKPWCSLECVCVSSHDVSQNLYVSQVMMQIRTCMCLKPWYNSELACVSSLAVLFSSCMWFMSGCSVSLSLVAVQNLYVYYYAHILFTLSLQVLINILGIQPVFAWACGITKMAIQDLSKIFKNFIWPLHKDWPLSILLLLFS